MSTVYNSNFNFAYCIDGMTQSVTFREDKSPASSTAYNNEEKAPFPDNLIMKLVHRVRFSAFKLLIISGPGFLLYCFVELGLPAFSKLSVQNILYESEDKLPSLCLPCCQARPFCCGEI